MSRKNNVPTQTQFGSLLLSNQQIQNNRNLLNLIIMNNGDFLMNMNPNPNPNPTLNQPVLAKPFKKIDKVGFFKRFVGFFIIRPTM